MREAVVRQKADQLLQEAEALADKETHSTEGQRWAMVAGALLGDIKDLLRGSHPILHD